jgi:hypothetical protein
MSVSRRVDEQHEIEASFSVKVEAFCGQPKIGTAGPGRQGHIGRDPPLDSISWVSHDHEMIRPLGPFFLCLASLFALPACTPCNHSGCDALGTPAADDHTSAIAGVIALESDAISNDCQECPFAAMDLSIWNAAGSVADASSAKTIIQAGPATANVHADGRYRQALDPGGYLLCASLSSYESACVRVEVVAGHVTPVNLKLLFGPLQFTVFDPVTRAPLSTNTLYPSW